MNTERTLVTRVRDDLRAAGYVLVLTDMRLPATGRRQRLDVVAFAADSTEALRPTVAVMIKHRADADPQSVLDLFALSRDVLGTRRHYLVDPDGWREAAGGLRRLQRVDGPAEPDRPGGEMRDTATAELLVRHDLWAESNLHEGGPTAALRTVRNMLAHFAGPAAVLAGQTVPMSSATRWSAVRDIVRQYLIRDRKLEPLLSQPALARPLAQLLGDVVPTRVEDPFVGLGAFLWAVADRVMEAGTVAYLSGTDINADVVELALAVGSLCPLPLQFRVGDSFRLQDNEPVDAVLTQPPLGLRLLDPFQLSSGASTRDGELAAIDVALSRLKPGGRAVLHVSRGWTWRRGDADRYRAYLSANFRVAALIGLPSGVYAGTTIPSMILVVDRAQPGDTFVAHLEANWAEELGPGGAVLTDCLKHLSAIPAPGLNRRPG